LGKREGDAKRVEFDTARKKREKGGIMKNLSPHFDTSVSKEKEPVLA